MESHAATASHCALCGKRPSRHQCDTNKPGTHSAIPGDSSVGAISDCASANECANANLGRRSVGHSNRYAARRATDSESYQHRSVWLNDYCRAANGAAYAHIDSDAFAGKRDATAKHANGRYTERDQPPNNCSDQDRAANPDATACCAADADQSFCTFGNACSDPQANRGTNADTGDEHADATNTSTSDEYAGAADEYAGAADEYAASTPTNADTRAADQHAGTADAHRRASDQHAGPTNTS
jgi:hypothetical protein